MCEKRKVVVQGFPLGDREVVVHAEDDGEGFTYLALKAGGRTIVTLAPLPKGTFSLLAWAGEGPEPVVRWEVGP